MYSSTIYDSQEQRIKGFQNHFYPFLQKRKENMFLLSTVHHNGAIDEAKFTKDGVDVVHELYASYSLSRNSQR